MKRRSNLTQSEGGQILIFVIIILMLAVLVIPAILALTYSSAHTIDIRTEKTQALYAADSGIEDALFALNNLGNGANPAKVPSNINGNQTYSLPGTYNYSQVQVTIKSLGNVTLYDNTYLPTYLITSTASSSANPTVTVRARVYVSTNVGVTYQQGPPVVGTSPFDYAMANLANTPMTFKDSHPPILTGDIYSNGPIDFPGASKVQSDGTHAGNVWANGTITLESSGVDIAGDVHSSGDITLGQTASIGGSAYAGGSIQVTGTASHISGSAEANGAINVQNTSGIAHNVLSNGNIHVSGPVYSLGYNAGNVSSTNGNVIVDNNGIIIGHVSAGGTVTHSNGIINGTIIEHAPQLPVSLPAIPTLVANDVAFWQNWYGDQAKAGPTTGSQNVGSGDLGPTYIVGDLSVDTNAVVQLTGTVYVTGDITIKEGVTILGPGTIVMEGTLSDKEGGVYGSSGHQVLLMSLSTDGIDTKSKGNQYCIFYAPYGTVNFQNWDTVYGAVIGQSITSQNGFQATWTPDVYSIPGLPGGYVSQGNETWTPVQQVTFTGPVIEYYKVCDTETCD